MLPLYLVQLHRYEMTFDCQFVPKSFRTYFDHFVPRYFPGICGYNFGGRGTLTVPSYIRHAYHLGLIFFFFFFFFFFWFSVDGTFPSVFR